MKDSKKSDRKPSKVKEIYDKMKAEKLLSQEKTGKGKRSPTGNSPGNRYRSNPRGSEKQNWHRLGSKRR